MPYRKDLCSVFWSSHANRVPQLHPTWYYTLNYNSSSKIEIKNMLSNNNSFCKHSDNLNNKKDANININTTKKFLEKIYKIYPSNDKKFKKVMIGNLYIQNCIF